MATVFVCKYAHYFFNPEVAAQAIHFDGVSDISTEVSTRTGNEAVLNVVSTPRTTHRLMMKGCQSRLCYLKNLPLELSRFQSVSCLNFRTKRSIRKLESTLQSFTP